MRTPYNKMSYFGFNFDWKSTLEGVYGSSIIWCGVHLQMENCRIYLLKINMALEKRDFQGFTGNMAFCAHFLFLESFSEYF